MILRTRLLVHVPALAKMARATGQKYFLPIVRQRRGCPRDGRGRGNTVGLRPCKERQNAREDARPCVCRAAFAGMAFGGRSAHGFHIELQSGRGGCGTDPGGGARARSSRPPRRWSRGGAPGAHRAKHKGGAQPSHHRPPHTSSPSRSGAADDSSEARTMAALTVYKLPLFSSQTWCLLRPPTTATFISHPVSAKV